MTKTERLINRIKEKESFYDVAYVCEDFETFEICLLYTSDAADE